MPSLTPEKRAAEYAGSWRWPNSRIGPSDAMKAYYLGYMDYPGLVDALRINGIDLNNVQADRVAVENWTKVLDASKPAWDAGLIRRLYALDKIKEDFALDNLKRHGIFMPEVRKHLLSASDPFDITTAFTLLNRDLISELRFDQNLIGLGVIKKEDRDKVLTLRNVIPGPGDIVQFAVKDGWDAEVVKAFRYAEEFPPELGFWLKKLGLDWKEDVDDGKGGKIPGVPWPLLYWIQHWQNIAPGQAYAFEQRLRPTGGPGGGPRVPGVEWWDRSDTNKILKVADYAPAFRDRLAALSYNVLGRIDARRLFRTGIIDFDELVEVHQDQGNTRSDAEKLSRWVDIDIRTQRAKRVTEETKGKIIELYKMGVIDKGEMKRQLFPLTMDNTFEVQAYNALPDARKDILVGDDHTVKHTAEFVDLEISLSQIKASIAGFRMAFITGHSSEAAIRDGLTRLGMIDSAINRYIFLWRTQLVGKYQELSTVKILKYYSRGIVSPDTAQQRLINLGWRSDDIRYMFAGVEYDANQVAAKAQLAAAKTAEKQRQARLKLMAAQQRAIEKAREKVLKEAHPAELVKWTLQGVITQAQYLGKMLGAGHTAEYALDLLASAQLPNPVKPKASKDGQPKSPQPTPPPPAPPPP